MEVAADIHGKVQVSTVFLSYSLHVSIVRFFTFRQKRVHGGSAFDEGNSAPLQHMLLARTHDCLSATHG